MRILVVGAGGMLGNAMLRFFANDAAFTVFGAVRTEQTRSLLLQGLQPLVFANIDAENDELLDRLVQDVRPDIILNCVGIVKQRGDADDPLVAIPINALLPHRLARLAAKYGGRLVHFSTDCVFSGAKGMYREDDLPDARDLYGRSKLLGETISSNAVTLRTSIIGHELNATQGLIGWFLSQEGRVKGYSRAIFSGLPTVELARVVRDFVLPRPDLSGVWHVGAAPIAKADLLELVAAAYGKHIEVERDPALVIDRSLDSSRFMSQTGYHPPDWQDLVRRMSEFR